MFNKIISLFKSPEKRFIDMVIEKIDEQNYVNLKKIATNMPYEKRIQILKKLISNKTINGILLEDNLYFFSADNELLEKMKKNVKENGRLEITSVKSMWQVNDKAITSLLRRFALGVMAQKYYYTNSYLSQYVKNKITSEEPFDLSKVAETLSISIENIIKITNELISKNELQGFIQDTNFIPLDVSNKILDEYMENVKEEGYELSFDKISHDLHYPIDIIEQYFLKYVDENPEEAVLYPLEKKIVFK